MKTDKLFYRIFQELPGLAAELLGGLPDSAVLEFSAPVVKDSEFRLDGLLTPAEPTLPLIFLEAQMQPDERFLRRYFASLFLYLAQQPQERDWRGLLLVASRSITLGWEVPYRALLQEHVSIVALDELAIAPVHGDLALLQLIALPEAAAVERARVYLSGPSDQLARETQLQLVTQILSCKLPRLSLEEIQAMLNLVLEEFENTRLYQQVMDRGLQKGRLEGLKEGLQEGLKEGLQEGLKEGRSNEARALVQRLLTRRCGNLSPSLLARVQALPLEQLEALSEALLDFTALADLEQWLAEQG